VSPKLPQELDLRPRVAEHTSVLDCSPSAALASKTSLTVVAAGGVTHPEDGCRHPLCAFTCCARASLEACTRPHCVLGTTPQEHFQQGTKQHKELMACVLEHKVHETSILHSALVHDLTVRLRHCAPCVPCAVCTVRHVYTSAHVGIYCLG